MFISAPTSARRGNLSKKTMGASVESTRNRTQGAFNTAGHPPTQSRLQQALSTFSPTPRATGRQTIQSSCCSLQKPCPERFAASTQTHGDSLLHNIGLQDQAAELRGEIESLRQKDARHQQPSWSDQQEASLVVSPQPPADESLTWRRRYEHLASLLADVTKESSGKVRRDRKHHRFFANFQLVEGQCNLCFAESGGF